MSQPPDLSKFPRSDEMYTIEKEREFLESEILGATVTDVDLCEHQGIIYFGEHWCLVLPRNGGNIMWCTVRKERKQ